MGRHIIDLNVSRPMEQAMADIQTYLTSEGFSKTTHEGEQVWKKGFGGRPAQAYPSHIVRSRVR